MPIASDVFPVDWRVPLVLVLVLAASSVVYWALVRRWTMQRAWHDLGDWAVNQDLRLRNETATIVPPAALSFMGPPAPRVLVSLESEAKSILQVEAVPPQGKTAATQPKWNIIIRRLEVSWPTVGLRPSARPATILDYLPLGGMHVMYPGERFHVYGREIGASRSIGKSRLRALLPPDIALLLDGPWIILDFSARPFDALEAERMNTLLDQLVAHLPTRK